jgi:hypothetical protein
MISSVEKIYSPITNEFDNYKVTYSDSTVSYVPLDPANSDYQAIQEWIAEGNEVIDNGA